MSKESNSSLCSVTLTNPLGREPSSHTEDGATNAISVTVPHQKSEIVREIVSDFDFYEDKAVSRMASLADSLQKAKKDVAANVMSNPATGLSPLWKGVNAWYSKNYLDKEPEGWGESERTEARVTKLVDTVRKTMSPEDYQTASDELIATVTEKMVAHKRCTNTLLNRMMQPSVKRKATGEALTLAKAIQRDTDLLTAVMINIENSNS